MSKEKRIVFRIEEELYDSFKDICEKRDKSVSEVLRNYIDKMVDKQSENEKNLISRT